MQSIYQSLNIQSISKKCILSTRMIHPIKGRNLLFLCLNGFFSLSNILKMPFYCFICLKIFMDLVKESLWKEIFGQVFYMALWDSFITFWRFLWLFYEFLILRKKCCYWFPLRREAFHACYFVVGLQWVQILRIKWLSLYFGTSSIFPNYFF